jgi:hypothetical protein
MTRTIALAVAGIVFIASSISNAQAAPEAALPDRLVIRAELVNGVNAAKAKPGDRVEMRALADEKDGDRVLIEKDAKLTGHVIAATGHNKASESRLELVIEGAQWKRHSIPLHAFVIAQGQVNKTQTTPCNERSPARDTTSEANTPGFLLCAEKGDTISRKQSSPVLKDVEIRYVRGRSGPTVLVSKKTNVVLPSGLVVLIRNISESQNNEK